MTQLVRTAMISQPMNGLTEQEIRDARHELVQALYDVGFRVVDTVFAEYETEELATNDRKGVYCLGKGLMSMATVDVVVFMPGWEKARGCRLEHDICEAYGIPYVDSDELDKLR